MSDKEFEQKLLMDTEEAIWDLIFMIIGMTIMCLPTLFLL